MADIIKLDYYRQSNQGNGALSVVRKYFDRMPECADNLHRGDHFLAWLWVQGFMVGPTLVSKEPIKSV